MRGAALDADHPGVLGQDQLQLDHRRVDVDQADHGCSEDPVLVGVSPVFLQPQVECVKGRDQSLGVVVERLLHAHPKGGEEETALEPLLVHDSQPSLAVAVLGSDGFEIAKEGAHILRLGIPTTEVFVEAARLGHRIEGWVRDEPVDLAAHQQTLAAVDLGPLHGPLGHLRLDEAGEGVGSLVVVVVGVERLGWCGDPGGCHDRISSREGVGLIDPLVP